MQFGQYKFKDLNRSWFKGYPASIAQLDNSLQWKIIVDIPNTPYIQSLQLVFYSYAIKND